VIVGVTIEETLPQELEKYGSDLERVTSEEIRNQVYRPQDRRTPEHQPSRRVGLVDYGDYVVLDVAAHLFLDADQKHKLKAPQISGVNRSRGRTHPDQCSSG
jgi:hypothetical protein